MNVHPLTNNPTEVWEELSKTQTLTKVRYRRPKNTVENHKLRVVCMSDTHSLTRKLKFSIPEGDVFIHAGDFSKFGHREEVIEFNNWLGQLPHKHKLVVAGNHELSFDENFVRNYRKKIHEKQYLELRNKDLHEAVTCVNVKSCLNNCIYLEDSEIVICGIKFYGSPWQPEFRNWAFNLPRGDSCLQKWNLIPGDTDVLITHSPPLGHGDLTDIGVRAGCVELLTTVQQRVKPKYHVFGHIHEGYGMTTDGNTIFINASTCDISYNPINQPFVFDIQLPDGIQK